MTVPPAPRENSVGLTVRRFVVFTLLIALVSVAASGAAGLLGQLTAVDDEWYFYGPSQLASNLAFTVIAGPLAALLWWLEWRLLREPAERGSALWGFYIATMSTVSLVLGASFLASTVSTAVSARWDSGAATGAIVWLLVWVWHRWMGRHPVKSPTRLVGGARILGSTFGVIIGAGGAVRAIAVLVDSAVGTNDPFGASADPWWTTALQAGIWALVGGLVWWLHWLIDGGARLRTGFATVMLVLTAGLAAMVMVIGGLAMALYTVLQLLFSADPRDSILAPLGVILGSTLVGALLWAYYRIQVRAASVAAQHGTQLVSSGVALAAAASGVGVLINAILAELVIGPIAGSDSRALLFAGLSALVVGGPFWWFLWKPLAPVTDEQLRDTSRKVYLIAIFGVSALVAIITLLIIGYQVFTFALASPDGISLLENVRASVGLLVATALVASYHFIVWRRDVARTPHVVAAQRSIAELILVIGGGADAAADAARTATGATVTVWSRADATTDVDPAEVVAALDGVVGARVLVIAESSGVRVIPLKD